VYVQDETRIRTGPLLLATKDVGVRKFISFGKPTPVTITLYNVGDRDALK
jgi:hypothetical protein